MQGKIFQIIRAYIGFGPKKTTGSTPGLDRLPLVSSRTYAYDPRIKWVACSREDKWIHLGYAITKGGKREIYAHCHRQRVGTLDYKELPGVDVGAINCKRCRDRLKILKDPNSPVCKAVAEQKRYYHGDYAIGKQKLSDKEIVHLYIVPAGSTVRDPELRPFCRRLVPRLTLTLLTDWNLRVVTCKDCRDNFTKLPARDNDGHPHGKADMWYIVGSEGFENLQPTIISVEKKEAARDDILLNVDDDDDDDEEVVEVTRYK